MRDEKPTPEDLRLRAAAVESVNRERRELERLDERWDRLAAGELDAEETAELRRLAESSPEAAAAWEAFRPLDPAFRKRMVEVARAGLSEASEAEAEAGRAGTPAAEGADPGSAPAGPSTAERPGAGLPGARRPETDRRAPRSPFGWLVDLGGVVRAHPMPIAAVAAAGLLALLVVPSGWRGAGGVPAPWPGLPSYELEISGGESAVRGGSPPERVFPPGSRLELVLRPEVAVEGPLEVRFYIEGASGLVPWRPPYEVSEAGAVRLDGRLSDELEIGGADAVVVVVGRPGELPDAAETARRLAAGATVDATWTAWRVELPAAAEAPEAPGGARPSTEPPAAPPSNGSENRVSG